ncbi:hypothetical protein SUDANB95_07465 [Actinosynnema sp. ALI-1.44]
MSRWTAALVGIVGVAAALAADAGDDTWRVWRLPLDLRPGGHTVESRATDKSGFTRPQARVAPVRDRLALPLLHGRVIHAKEVEPDPVLVRTPQ